MGKKLHDLGQKSYVLDGDNIRHGLNKDLGFSAEDRVVLGNIAPKRDFIYTADISRALRIMSGKEGLDFGTFNVGTGEEHSVVEIVNVISELLGKPIKIICEEGRKRKLERFHLSADTSRIRSTLGWRPQVTLKDGFRDMLESVSLL